jgi:hypothetical protein
VSENIVTKSAVSVTEMARMVGLSRARFYQLVRSGTFPVADQDEITQRPFFSEDKQRQILEARRRNCGVNGKAVLFYSRRRDFGSVKVARTQKPQVKCNHFTELMDGLAALNVTTTAAQVEPVVKELFPQGTDGMDQGEVVRAVFLRIHRQHSTGSVGR